MLKTKVGIADATDIQLVVEFESCYPTGMNNWQIEKKPAPPFISSFSESLVTPEDIKRAKEQAPKTSFGLIVKLGLGALAVAIMPASGILPKYEAMLKSGAIDGTGVLLLVLSPFVIFWLIGKFCDHCNYKSKLKKIVLNRVKQNQQSALAREEYSVSQTANDLKAIHEKSIKNLILLNSLVEKAEKSLDRAGRKFSERSFNPFWDSVEDAVGSLTQFKTVSADLWDSSERYYQLLEGRRHNFPLFPVNKSDVPDPMPILETLNELNDKAQCDHQFAVIFTQRGTTRAVMEGFRNMEEVISSLRDDVVSSISDLNESLDSGLQGLSENQRESFERLSENSRETATEAQDFQKAKHLKDAEHQEFVEDALDNIQAKRKPRFSEQKHPYRLK